MQQEPPALTQLLQAWSAGEKGAVDRLIPEVYGELRRLARAYLRREPPGLTLQTTALVNEAYIRLVGQRRVQWQSRGHFFGVTAQIMRRILVDCARARRTAKRGDARLPIPLDEDRAAATPVRDDVESLNEALQELEQVDPRQGQIVELRFFGGLTHEEIAVALGISVPTVEREWRTAKMWLRYRMSRRKARGAGSA
ncbi:MAG TPA: sigma-70 family RNA polymerase sigma factor [Vicinamibacterales bacterium]